MIFNKVTKNSLFIHSERSRESVCPSTSLEHAKWVVILFNFEIIRPLTSWHFVATGLVRRVRRSNCSAFAITKAQTRHIAESNDLIQPFLDFPGKNFVGDIPRLTVQPLFYLIRQGRHTYSKLVFFSDKVSVHNTFANTWRLLMPVDFLCWTSPSARRCCPVWHSPLLFRRQLVSGIDSGSTSIRTILKLNWTRAVLRPPTLYAKLRAENWGGEIRKNNVSSS